MNPADGVKGDYKLILQLAELSGTHNTSGSKIRNFPLACHLYACSKLNGGKSDR